jgi:uncharacterized protein involved in exopolysaccharide biosynthesis
LNPTGRVRDEPLERPLQEENEYALIAEPVASRSGVLPYLQLFWENRRQLLRAAVWATLVSVSLAFLIPVRYDSVTRLMPPDGQSGSGLGMLAAMALRSSSTGMGGGLMGDLLGVKSSGALFVGIVRSETVQDRLIEKYDLRKVYHKSKIEDARKKLAERTDVSEDRRSGIISLTVTDHDPKRAADMARTYVAELDRLVAQVSTSSARRERIFLEGRLEKVKTDLDTASRNFSDYASKNTAIDIPAQGKAMVEAAAALQGQLIAAESELRGLRQIYTENNIRVRAAEARTKELRDQLNQIGGVGTQEELSSNNSLYPSIRKLPLLGVKWADLYRESKIQETVYELLTQQYELAKVQEAREIPTVKVLDPAMVPTKKSFPPRMLITVLGAMLGVVLAMIWIAGRLRWEAIDVADPRKALANEVLRSMRPVRLRFLALLTRVAAARNGSGIRSLWRKTEPVHGENSEREEANGSEAESDR